MDGYMGHQIPGGKIRKERRKGSTVHACSDFKATLHSSGSSTIKLRIKKKAQEGQGHSQIEVPRMRLTATYGLVNPREGFLRIFLKICHILDYVMYDFTL
jgi:hypothetical protein